MWWAVVASESYQRGEAESENCYAYISKEVEKSRKSLVSNGERSKQTKSQFLSTGNLEKYI